MCGILAYAGAKPIDAQACLKRMAHRGPDNEATLQDGDVVFGHVRLSIIDVSSASDQPMKSMSGKTTIVFNGEIYNYQELRSELLAEGVQLRTHGDTEVILEGYERHGTSFFKRLRGMWTFVIHDHQKNTLILARDPFGIKPLVYAVRDGSIAVASELRGLPESFRSEPDPESYAAFYTLGYFIAPATPYKDVYRLRPGEVLSWSLTDKSFTTLPSVSRFMDDGKGTEHVDSHSAQNALDAALTDSVAAHYVSDVPVSMLLSGGTDSSLIAALSKKLGKDPVAYHIAIEGSEDTRYATDIAAHLGITLETQELSQTLLEEQYEKVWDIIDEPTGDISIIPTSLVFERIKGKAKVVLSGEGGDELFGGYQRHSMLRKHDFVRATHPVASLLNSMRSLRGDSSVWNPSIERARSRVIGSGVVNDLVGAYLSGARLMRTELYDRDVRAQLVALYEETRDERILPMLAFDVASYLPNDLLLKSDTASMAVSIEARVPMVDRCVASVSAAMLAATGKPLGDKRILKDVLAQYIPHELAFRGKSGFGVPIHSYDSRAFLSDFEKACDFHTAHADSFGVVEELRMQLASKSARDVIARKFPRFAFALISNWKYFTRDASVTRGSV